MDNLSKNLKKYREKAGITSEQLAEEIGVNKRYIDYMERGDKTPSLKLAKRIADVLKVSLDELVA